MGKPVKPYEDFPLTPHPKGWYVKHNGRSRFVCGGHLTAKQVLAEWDRKRVLWDTERTTTTNDDRPPTFDQPGLDLGELAERFLASKAAQVAEGMTARTHDEYCEAVADFAAVVDPSKCVADLMPADFQKHRLYLSNRFGLHRRKKFMILVRSLFKWAVANDHIARLPRYGTEYNLPSKSDLRKAEGARRREHGDLLFEPRELGAIFAACECRQFRAMILLALNGGYGQEDLSQLSSSVVDLKAGLIDDVRNKTGVRRRAFLWAETIKAIRDMSADRPAPALPEMGTLLFLTKWGNPWVHDVVREGRDGVVATCHKDAAAVKFGHLTRSAQVYRRGRNFYSLRRTFRTCADELRDQRAVAMVMGHEVGDVADLYVERISDERLKAVANHVRQHLLLPALKAEGAIRRKVLKAAG